MSGSPRQALLEQLASVAKCLGHPHRLALLEHLAQGEWPVETLAERTRLSNANASQHLQQMRRAGLVAARREGRFIFYRIEDYGIIEILAGLRRFAERNLAEVELTLKSYYSGRDELEAVTRPELLERMRDGLVTILDVRPPEEFEAGHLPGAVNLSAEELETRFAELDPGCEVVAYCRGPYCLFSFEAVALLRSRGYKARRLEEGFPEWKSAGLPIEESTARPSAQ